jgi:integrase
MSAATFKPELKKPPRQDGTCAVRIRITRFRQHSYWNVGRYVLPGEWNLKPKRHLKNWVLKNALAPQINNAIANTLSNLEAIADANPGYTAAQIKEAYEQQLNPVQEIEPGYRNFFNYAAEFTDRTQATNFATGKNMKYNINSFKAFAGENTPLTELFSVGNLQRYILHCRGEGNSPVTIFNKLKDLRTVYNAGVREKQLPDIGKPFTLVKVTVPKKKKDRPTAAQVLAFVNYAPENELQEMAKTVALLQYLLQGARLAEALTLEWANVKDTYIEYLPQKGAKKPKFVPRSEALNRLLESQPKEGRYVLPYIRENYPLLTARQQLARKTNLTTAINTGLNEIAEKLEFKIDLTSHMFRHAFADALIAAGANPHTAAALLGHSNPKTTEGYIKDLGLEEVSGMALYIFDKLGKP